MKSISRARFLFKTYGVLIIVSSIAFINGFVVLLGTLFERYYHIRPLNFILVMYPQHVNKSLSLVLGLVLIYLATKLWRRSHMAWIVYLSTSVILLFIHVIFGHHFFSVLTLMFTVLILIVYRHEFQVRNDRVLLVQGVLRSGLILLAALAYGTVGFWLLFDRDFNKDFSLSESFIHAVRELLLMGNPSLVTHTHYAYWFVNSLDLVGIAAAILAFVALFEPLRYRLVTQPHEHNFVRYLLDKYGHDSEDFFKLWPRDKRYFISHRAAIAYKVKNDIAIILGDPVGNSSDFPNLVAEFYEMARLSGWQVSAVHCRAEASRLYEKQRSKSIIVGSEAVIDIAHFLTMTSNNKHWRNIRNRFTKAGFESELIRAPISDSLYHELKVVSDQWLKLPGREEMTFGLGYFDKHYIVNSDIMCLRNSDGQLVAFANLVRSYDKTEANIDLLRHLPDAPSNVNDYLCYSLIKELGSSGVFKYLNLGLCPLKGVDETDSKSPTTQVMKLVYGSNALFSFQGLVQFKSKFEPSWRERYLVYQGGTAGLVRSGLAINKAFRLDKE